MNSYKDTGEKSDMPHKKNTSAILVAISVIALTLVTAASFNHYYSASAASKTKTGSGDNSASSASASAAASTTNPKTLSKKELNSFISCINTANKSQGLTHKVVTNCLDTAKGITPAINVGGTAAGGSTTGSATAAATAGAG